MRYNKETKVKCPKCSHTWTSQLKLEGTPGVQLVPSTIDYETVICPHCGYNGEMGDFKKMTQATRIFECKNCGYVRHTHSNAYHKLCPRCDQDNWEDVSDKVNV